MDTDVVTVRSRRLGEPVAVVVGSTPGTRPDGVVWLLHGRGAADEVPSVLAAVDAPAWTVLAPLGRWCDGAHWWADSAWEHGRAVQSALTREVLPAAEAALGLQPGRRVVAGWSMGGAGALRWLAGHPGLAGAVLVAPAVYLDQPPVESSARSSGAFGVGPRRFDLGRFRELTSASLRASAGPARPVHLLVGADEEPQQHLTGAWSLVEDARRLHHRLQAVPGLDPSFDVLPGGHTASLWPFALRTGLSMLAR